ncbi:uncharacterized protein BDCG_02984 [Blastomyces dermatitidis ER-3]|uniref:Aminoglycoside phosphotransferase domain-containing protein n=1 Tax=Ajellomyces dermatitidis (strain ER-3 / ATCC MYA-2586) TaxID=559297 RepID=A0ABP2EW22_AJEDR|nr:uncharacterized protein BDCG_02984 [Blastomyces dermatitidis ER-3]EEQ87864.1 hypothetical protein BDCG_02984 [Blastomyces dermatitidis ER-3]
MDMKVLRELVSNRIALLRNIPCNSGSGIYESGDGSRHTGLARISGRKTERGYYLKLSEPHEKHVLLNRTTSQMGASEAMSSNFIRPDTCLSFFLGASTALVLTLPVIYFFGRNQSPPTSSVTPLCSTELDDAARKGGCDEDGDALSGFIALNESATTELRTKLNWNRSADLSKFFIRWGRKYPSDRRKLEEVCGRKSQSCRGSNTPNTRQIQEAFLIPAEIPVILRPLAPEVNTLLRKYGCEQDCLSSSNHDDQLAVRLALSRALQNGKVLWGHFSRAVIQLDERIVVKLGHNLLLTDADITAYIQSLSKDIPVPHPLGAISIGKTTYMFMTFIEGSSLDKLWSSLSTEEKFSIRDQLDVILEKLRMLPLSSHCLGGGNPPYCIDCRMWKRVSPQQIENEAQFNEFLISGNHPPTMRAYVEFVHSMLRNDHRIVMTHGDLHPRNIMVSKERDQSVRVTGLVDWELGGVYPEYWEFLKSLNTMLPVRRGDWVFFLPHKGMGMYFAEFAIDQFVEKLVS